jgi:hypothetical protein
VESVVVVVDVVIYLAVEVGTGLSRIQVDVVFFDGSPESFDPRIVCCTPLFSTPFNSRIQINLGLLSKTKNDS